MKWKKKMYEQHINALKSIRGKARKTISDLEEIKRKLKTETSKPPRERGTPEAIIKKRKSGEEDGISEKRERSEGGTKRNQITKCKLSKKNRNYNKCKKSIKCKKNRKCKKSRKI